MPYNEFDEWYCANCGNRECYDCGSGCNDCGTCECGSGIGREGECEAPPMRIGGDLAFMPLRNLLLHGGTDWSAEVELRECSVSGAARAIGCDTGGYSDSGGRGEILSTADCTVDVEVKLSRMTDGNDFHAEKCRDAYSVLRSAGALADTYCGHHVHVDATEIARIFPNMQSRRARQTAAERVVRSAVLLGAACDRTLTALAASGYTQHREDSGNTYGGDWNAERPNRDRGKLHGSRLHYAMADGTERGATVEYRLPNGTAYAERAHAHVAIALGLVDVAKRAQIHYDREAVAIVRRAREALKGWEGGYLPSRVGFSEEVGASFLCQSLPLHGDSIRALALAAMGSPATQKHRKVWLDAAAKTTTSKGA